MTKEQALARLQMQCGRGEYCTKQIKDKLIRWVVSNKVGNEDVEWIVNSLIEDKFIDDSRFAQSYVRDKFKLSGWGRRKIEYQLYRLGITAGVIEVAVKENYSKTDGGRDLLLSLVNRKWNALKKEEPLVQKRLKVLRFATGRGFEYDDIMAALRKIE